MLSDTSSKHAPNWAAIRSREKYGRNTFGPSYPASSSSSSSSSALRLLNPLAIFFLERHLDTETKDCSIDRSLAHTHTRAKCRRRRGRRSWTHGWRSCRAGSHPVAQHGALGALFRVGSHMVIVFSSTFFHVELGNIVSPFCLLCALVELFNLTSPLVPTEADIGLSIYQKKIGYEDMNFGNDVSLNCRCLFLPKSTA